MEDIVQLVKRFISVSSNDYQFTNSALLLIERAVSHELPCNEKGKNDLLSLINIVGKIQVGKASIYNSQSLVKVKIRQVYHCF